MIYNFWLVQRSLQIALKLIEYRRLVDVLVNNIVAEAMEC